MAPNFATTEYGAKIIEGESPLALFRENITDCAWETGNTQFLLLILNNVFTEHIF